MHLLIGTLSQVNDVALGPFVVFVALVKKGAYCFASVGWSVDLAMSAQYLLTP